MRTQKGELTMQVRYAPQSFDRLEALRYIADQRSITSTAVKLLDMTLVKNQAEVPVPPQPDPLTQPRKPVFMHLRGDIAAVVSEGAAEHELAPSRFVLYAVEHSLEMAAQEIPELDIIAAIHNNASVGDRRTQYLP